MRIKTILITLLTALLLIVSCNTDNDGIFMQVSKSEEKTDVGSIVLLLKDGTTFYSRTRQHQLQTYDTDTKKWTLIEDAKATHATTDGTDIYYAASIKEEEGKHKIYQLGDSNVYSNTFKIVSMNPIHDLMLVEDSGKYDVYQVSDTSATKIDAPLEFYETYTPQLIAMGTNLFLVSGKTESDKYTHHLYDGSPTPKVITTINAPVIALLKDGAKIVLLTSKNEIYASTDSGATFTKADDNIPNFPTTRSPAGAPYPAFEYDSKLYLQNRHNYLYTIDGDGKVVIAEGIELTAVKGWSYIVIGDKVYVGTSQNGIYEIDMSDKSVTAL